MSNPKPNRRQKERVRPQDDFDSYANGKWYAKNSIPDHLSTWGVWDELNERNLQQLREIMENVSGSDTSSDPEGSSCNSEVSQCMEMMTHSELLKNFWLSGMRIKDKPDCWPRNHAKTTLTNMVRACRGVGAEGNWDLATICGKLIQWGVGPVMWFPNQDMKDSEIVLPYFCQGSLNLGDRAYYLEGSEKMQEIRQKYLEFITKLDAEFGFLRFSTQTTASNTTSNTNSTPSTTPSEQPTDKPANDEQMSQKIRMSAAREILELETLLAQATPAPEVRRIPEKTYHRAESIEEFLNYLNPEGDGSTGSQQTFNWKLFMEKSGVRIPSPQTPLIIEWPEYYQRFMDLVKSVSKRTWQNYLSLCVVRAFGAELAPDLFFNFYGKVLKGRKQIRPQWQRMVAWTNSCLGEALGKLYVEKHFPESSKLEVENMVERLCDAFAVRIADLDWMEEETKQAALDKLDALGCKIGYPEDVTDYTQLCLQGGMTPNNFVANLRAAAVFDHWDDVDRLYKGPDPDEWEMTPQTINAYYHPERNEIVFPAAILQPPFYDPEADPGTNYGAIGAVIGHEITHAFDDQGSKFDGDGNLEEWWTEADRKRFEERTRRIVEQFNECELRGYKINGELTQGENIADLGGLLTAFDAMPRTERSFLDVCCDLWFTAETDPDLPRKQAFFRSWANVWKCLCRDEYLRDQVLHDPHSPAKLRINMPLSNMQAFYDVFFVKEGDALYRPEGERVSIW